MRTVWDASAILALLNREPGWQGLVDQAPGVVSAVNLSETVAKLADSGMPEEALRSALQALGMDVRPFDEEQAIRAGVLRSSTRGLGLSLGDRCCLALGSILDKPVLTTDRRWSELDPALGIDVRMGR